MNSGPLDIVIVGGGPSGLYLATLLKKARPDHSVRVLERNRLGDAYGFGVVFSDETLDNFRDADRPS
ncbi:MAG: NAD(P)-binding protein, partial [Actinomycetota bacterium]|nr:NAD(P)-binding protein [Actinomycetota bacterium]